MKYLTLSVGQRVFALDHLPSAVEYLFEHPSLELILSGTHKKFPVQALIPAPQAFNKTPDEIWAVLDHQMVEVAQMLDARFKGCRPAWYEQVN